MLSHKVGEIIAWTQRQKTCTTNGYQNSFIPPTDVIDSIVNRLVDFLEFFHRIRILHNFAVDIFIEWLLFNKKKNL